MNRLWKRSDRRSLVVVFVAAIAGLGLGASYWSGPLLRALVPMARPEWAHLQPDVQAQMEGQFRLALVQMVAAVGAGVALVYTGRNYRLSRRGQVTDRFTKALERLGSDELDVRIGGVLALEQIVQDSPEQAAHAAHVLAAFIRRRAPEVPDMACHEARVGLMGAAALRAALNRAARASWRLPERPDADVAAALTALTRPESRRQTDSAQHIDLRGLYLVGAHLTGADLSGTWLHGADLSGAWLENADLTDATLINAKLIDAKLVKANLAGALLENADLTIAKLDEADLTGSWLENADLTFASFRCADLTMARHLCPEQVVMASSLVGAGLPPDIASHPVVTAHTAESPDERARRYLVNLGWDTGLPR